MDSYLHLHPPDSACVLSGSAYTKDRHNPTCCCVWITDIALTGLLPPSRCSLCDNAQLPQLFQMWAAHGKGTRREVLLLQVSASYFAVAPVLRALQAGPRLGALDRYLLHTEPGQPLPVVAPPVYMAAPGAGTWDLWGPLVCEDKVAGLQEGERVRWELEGALVLLLPAWCGSVLML